MDPLSCKFDQFLTVLSQSNEEIADWLGLDNSFAIFKGPGYEHPS